MDCCNYMEYQLQSIYNYNRAQYNDTGGGGAYLNGGGYHHQTSLPPPPTYCSYNNGNGFQTAASAYHHQNNAGPSSIHHPTMLPPTNNPFNDFNPAAIPRPLNIGIGYHHYGNDPHHGRTNTMGGYHHQYPTHGHHHGGAVVPPPPPLPPPAQLWNGQTTNGTVLGATDYSYNPKEARARKAQREALRSRQSTSNVASNNASLQPSPQHRTSYTPLPSTSRLDMASPHQMQSFMPTYTQQPLGSSVGSISGGGIINASSSGSRPSSVAPTTPRKPPPPYPGSQRTFSALEPPNRDFTMGYGDQSAFSPFHQNVYPNPISEHSNSIYDMRYQNNSNIDSTLWNGMQTNPNLWNSNYDIEQQQQHQSTIDANYPYPNDNRRTDHSTLLNEQSHVSACASSASNSEQSNSLNQIYQISNEEMDVYNYHKNMLGPKDLNISIKQEDTRDELNTQRPMEQFSQMNTSISYNSNMYKQEIMSHVSPYHPKMSPKPHSEETRMSPYNRPTHSPKTSLNDNKLTSKDLLNYRISPKTVENKMSPKRHNSENKKSPKGLKGSATNHHSSSPTSFKPENSRKSPKVQTASTNNTTTANTVQNIKVEEPIVENKHPLPAFTKAFSGTERGRLLATPELINNTNSTDPLQSNNTGFEYLNIDLFEDDEQKINFDQINELNNTNPQHTFTDTI